MFKIPGTNEEYRWTPRLHVCLYLFVGFGTDISIPQFSDDLRYFYDMYRVADTTASNAYIHTFKHVEFVDMPHNEVLAHLRTGHLLITDRPVRSRKFDANGLRRLGSLNRMLTIHGVVYFHYISSNIMLIIIMSYRCIQIILFRRSCMTDTLVIVRELLWVC